MPIKHLYNPGAGAFRRRAAGVSAASCRHAALIGPRAASTQNRKSGCAKNGRIYCAKLLALLSETCYISCIKRAPAGGGAADGGNPFRQRPGGNRPPDRQNSSFSLTFSNIFPSPEQAAARKTGGREPFYRSPFAARRGPDGRGQSPHRRAHPQRKVVMPMIARK